MYKLSTNLRSDIICAVTKLKDDGGTLYIPFDPTNTDYQEYLAWLAEGNEPEPADEQ